MTIEVSTTTHRDEFGRTGLRERVATFGTLLAGLALVVMAWGLELDAAAPLHLSVWVIVVLVAISEISVVHLEHTRGQSFTLREIPLVLGLFYASSPDLILGTVIGGAAVAAIHRRERGVRLAFAVGRSTMQVGLAIVVFGVYPQLMFKVMDPAVTKLVDQIGAGIP